MILQNINISTFNDINNLNNSIPQLISDSWYTFFINTFNTVNLSAITTANYLQMYLFTNNSNIFSLELSGYYLLTIFTLIFGYLYIKPTIRYATFYLLNISEIIWYTSVIYILLMLINKNHHTFKWIDNFFDIHSIINTKFTIIILLVTTVFFSSFISILKNQQTKTSPEILILIFLVICFGCSLLEINNFALFIVCLEGFSLTLYILATTSRIYGSIAASIKYFIFGTLGSILLYWGSLIIFEISASMETSIIAQIFESKFDLINNNIILSNEQYIKATFASSLIIIGFLIKLGAAPFHQWIPDVYSGVSMFITAFFAIIVKTFLFLLFLKFALTFITLKEIEYASLLSIIIGCFGTIRQTELKRFLAYGSITHTGYLLMGDLVSTYIYLITYMLASIILFSIILNITINGKELIYLSDLRYLGKSMSTLDRTVFVIILASMAGLPPFAGFYGKMLVWMSLIEDIYLYNDYWSFILLFINLLLALFVIFYYMQVLCLLFVNDEHDNKFLTITENLYFTNIKETNLILVFNQNIRTKILQGSGALLLTFGIFILPNFYNII